MPDLEDALLAPLSRLARLVVGGGCGAGGMGGDAEPGSDVVSADFATPLLLPALAGMEDGGEAAKPIVRDVKSCGEFAGYHKSCLDLILDIDPVLCFRLTPAWLPAGRMKSSSSTPYGSTYPPPLNEEGMPEEPTLDEIGPKP